MAEAFAEVEVTTALNNQGREQECVYATCIDSGVQVGPVWGTGEGSVRRALAELTEECNCGASFHLMDKEE